MHEVDMGNRMLAYRIIQIVT